MKRLTLNREIVADGYVVGAITYTGDKTICKTLELPWKDNQRDISCIPGNVVYKAKYNPAIKRIEIYNVIDRDNVQIHAGNMLDEIKGCILPGFEIELVPPFIYDSRAALQRIVEIVGEEIFELVIVDASNTTTFYKSLQVVSGDRRTWRDIGQPVTIMDQLPEPDATKVDVKVNLWDRFMAWDGKKRLLGALGVVAGLALMAFGYPIGEQVATVSAGLGAVGVVHAAYKSAPAHNGKAGWFWKLVESFLTWLNKYIGDNVK